MFLLALLAPAPQPSCTWKWDTVLVLFCFMILLMFCLQIWNNTMAFVSGDKSWRCKLTFNVCYVCGPNEMLWMWCKWEVKMWLKYSVFKIFVIVCVCVWYELSPFLFSSCKTITLLGFVFKQLGECLSQILHKECNSVIYIKCTRTKLISMLLLCFILTIWIGSNIFFKNHDWSY